MALPIEPTPVLRGKDAIRFLELMLHEEKHPNPARIKFLEEAKRMKFKVRY